MIFFKKSLYTIVFVFLVSFSSTLPITIAQSDKDLTNLPTTKDTKQEEEITSYNISNIDQEKLQSTWFGRVNEIRNNNKQDNYEIDQKLMKTSIERSQTLAENNVSTWSVHKRATNDGFYDYKKISQRFKERDIDTAVFTESIGRGSYSCNADDCTDSLIKSVKATFSFFAGEASRNGPHYRSIVSGKYSKIGLGIAINPKAKKYFLVMHVSD